MQVARILGPSLVIFTENGIAPHNRGSTVHQWQTAAQNPGSLASGLIDIALLSLCDDIVMTHGSSFGWIAAAWGGVAPVRSSTVLLQSCTIIPLVCVSCQPGTLGSIAVVAIIHNGCGVYP